MSEKAFRLDFFIAIAALVVSALSTLTLVYQTHVIGQQYAATTWPYLDVESDLSNAQERILVRNDGLGPALIRSAQLTVDGKVMRSWNDYLELLAGGLPATARKPGGIYASLSSIGPSSAIRPGDSIRLIQLDYKTPELTNVIERHRIEVSFCYCSLSGDCWLHRTTPGVDGSTTNTATAACTSTSSIASYRTTSPSARPRRK